MWKTVKLLLFSCVIMLAMPPHMIIQSVGANPTTLVVPDDYSTIQGAINAATVSDRIFIHGGVYHESLIIDKSIILEGENPTTTIIDGSSGGMVGLAANRVTIRGITIQNGGGIATHDTDGHTFENDIIQACDIGLHLEHSYHNVLRDNLIQDNRIGFHMYDCGSTTMRRNTLRNNLQSNFYFRSWGYLEDSAFVQDIDASNTVDGKPIYWWQYQSNKQVPIDAGLVFIKDSYNIIMKDLTLSGNSHGINLLNVVDSTIENVNASRNENGLMMSFCHNNLIRDCSFTSNTLHGLMMQDSYENDLVTNRFEDNNRAIWLYDFQGATERNKFWHNNFVDNNVQVFQDRFHYANAWDDGYPSGGNYWSDYTGSDQDGDGIGDASYTINILNKDNYPLMSPWRVGEIHDVAITNVVPQFTPVTIGEQLPVYVTAANLGTQPETFSVTGYYGDGMIGFNATRLTLNAGEDKTLEMTWDTTGILPSSYRIGAYASQVSGETNLANNEYSDGKVVIKGLPDSPQQLVAQPMNNGVDLTWVAPSRTDMQMYHIYRGTSSDFELVGSDYRGHVGGSTLKFEDRGLSENTIYYYRVIASFPEGFSAPSDAVPCARLESFKGVLSTITGANSLFLSVPMGTFQQNFYLNTGARTYWCQNVVVFGWIGAFPTHSLCLYATMQVWDKSSNDRVYWSPNLVYLGTNVPDVIEFDSEIVGSGLVLRNTIGSWSFDMKLTDDAYITKLDQGGIYQPPNFVVVGPPNGGEADFTGGNGHVSCQTMIGDQWIRALNLAVVAMPKETTKEWSKGLKWLTNAQGQINGDFEHQEEATAQGIFFVPDFTSPTAQAPSIESLGEAATTLVYHADCPVYLDLYDELGRCVGHNSTSGKVDAQIPNAIWESNQTILVFDPSGKYHLVVVGTESGSFTLQITLQNENGSATVLLNETDTIRQRESFCWILNGANATNSVSRMSRFDLNMDGRIDIRDISIAARAFGSSNGDVQWNPMPDVNADNHVDIRDIAQIARHFGDHYL